MSVRLPFDYICLLSDFSKDAMKNNTSDGVSCSALMIYPRILGWAKMRKI